MRGDPPAHDAAAERVGDETHISDAGPGGDVGQIGDPQPVRPFGGEGPLDKIGGPCRFGIGPGGAHRLCPLDASDPELAHQAGHLVAADVVPGASGGDPQLTRPVHRVVGLPQHQQQRHQLGVA